MSGLLLVEDVRTEFPTSRGTVHALNGITFSVDAGEIVGVVGESGSGKSTAVRSIIRLVPPPGRVTGGRVALDGRDLLSLRRGELREIRGRRIGFIAQNPFGALNPVLRVEKQFENIVRAHRRTPKREIHEHAASLLSATGIPDPERVLRGYAHELSGGMAQRVVIAMSLCLDPELLIADEPTTALDLTVQRQILNTLRELVRTNNRALLLVTHDLGVVASYCDRVIVMYAGKVVEQGPTHLVFAQPGHPYTRALLRALPGTGEKPVALRGSVPDLIDYPAGCPYRARCAIAVDRCVNDAPELSSIAPDRLVACHVPLKEEAGRALASR